MVEAALAAPFGAACGEQDRHSELLTERDWERAVLSRNVESARSGRGAVTVIEGPPGRGKTRLLHLAEQLARNGGFEILSARGSELEQNFPFGGAIQLFESRWLSIAGELRPGLSTGPTRTAAALLEGRLHELSPEPSDNGYLVIHGLFWLAANLSLPHLSLEGSGPLALVVDDAQWLDRPSVRFLAYLAARITNLPLALFVAMRSTDDASPQPELAALQTEPNATVLSPRPLSRRGVQTTVRAEFPDAHRAFTAACYHVTKGNPFLLTELVRHMKEDRLAPDEATAGRLSGLVPGAIVDAVAARLGRMPPAERALATAVAVLGDGALLPHAARLAEYDVRAASQAADSLAQLHVLKPGVPLTFAHPVVRAALLTSLSPLSTAQAHLRAARILREGGASPEAVAGHLLAAPPENDPAAVNVLRMVASDNLRSGDAPGAVRLLRRALSEHPDAKEDPDLLAELGHAEASAGMPIASERLQTAIEVTREPSRRAELALARGRVLQSAREYRQAATTFASGRLEVGETNPRLADELEASWVAAAALVPDLAEAALKGRQTILENLDNEAEPIQRAAIGHSVILDSYRGETREHVRRIADAAWCDGALLSVGASATTALRSIIGALVFVDELERALEICVACRESERPEPMPLDSGAIAAAQMLGLYARGQIADALSLCDVESALSQSPSPLPGPAATLALCHIAGGEIGGAENIVRTGLSGDGLGDHIDRACLLDARAHLRLAQHRPAEALDDALAAGELLESEFGVSNPGVVAWGSTAALACAASGDAERAEQFASEELERAQRIGVPRAVIRDVRILGLIVGGDQGLELLKQAVEIASQMAPRLESMLALVDLGAALRRSGKRAAARDPLRRALDLSHRAGATAIAERAQTELAATGARPRRLMLTGIDALTPSERRVADLAVQGITTRSMAEALFITPKTVEYHLRHIYQKLDVNSRSALADILQSA